MKVIINNRFCEITWRESGWAVLSLRPDTNGPKFKKVHVYVVPHLVETKQDEKGLAYKTIASRASVIRDKNGNYVLVPERNPNDNRAFVIDGQNRPGHRRWASLKAEISTAQILGYTEGYGAWGAGFACAAIFRPGDRIIDTTWRIVEYDGNQVSKYQSSEAEFYGEQCSLEGEEL